MIHHNTPLPRLGVVCFKYGFVWNKIYSYTAPLVRLFTGVIWYNHGEILVEKGGTWFLMRAAEHDVELLGFEQAISRPGAQYIIKEYTGSKTPEEVFEFALQHLGKKYDTPALFHQLLYRVTETVAHWANCFLGRKKFSGIWPGRNGVKARNKYGCFEYVFDSFGLPNATHASGREFEALKEFKTIYSTVPGYPVP